MAGENISKAELLSLWKLTVSGLLPVTYQHHTQSPNCHFYLPIYFEVIAVDIFQVLLLLKLANLTPTVTRI
jgi:hypothetical protein